MVKKLLPNGTDLLETIRSLVRMGLSKVTVPRTNQKIVSVTTITRIDCLIPAREESEWIVNSCINVKIFYIIDWSKI
jgi:hypothetical protein